MVLRFPVAVLLAAVLAAGCGGIVDPSQNQIETFTGTIAPGGQSQPGPHGFSASKTGEISVKVTQITPSSSNTFIGVIWPGRAEPATVPAPDSLDRHGVRTILPRWACRRSRRRSSQAPIACSSTTSAP